MKGETTPVPTAVGLLSKFAKLNRKVEGSYGERQLISATNINGLTLSFTIIYDGKCLVGLVTKNIYKGMYCLFVFACFY